MSDENGHANGAPSAPATGPTKRAYGALRLSDARERTPAVGGLGAWAERMRDAAMDAVGAEDVAAIVAAQVERAKGGDPAAAKFVLAMLDKLTPPAPAPLRVQGVEAAEPDPPRPVAVPGPAADAHRRLAAFVLLAHQPMSVAGLGAQCGLAGADLDAVLNHEWFARQNGSVRLTPTGRQAVG